MGINLDDLETSQQYRTNINKSEEFYVKRLCNPLMHHPFIYNLCSDSKRYYNLIHQIHTFSSHIITKRRQQFDNIIDRQRSQILQQDPNDL